MGVPPAFNPPRQQGSNKIWLWLILAFVAFCIVCGIAAFFMMKNLAGTGLGMINCALNGDLARNAVLAYAMDHDGKLPNAKTWQDDIRPYYERLYQKMAEEMDFKEMPDWFRFEPAAPGTVLECSLGSKKTGFAFNSAMSEKLVSDFPDPKTAILIFETLNPSYNAFGSPDDRPKDDPALRMYGDKRNWVDFPIEGKTDMLKSGDEDFDFEIDPKDGLPSEPPTTTGGPTPTGA